MERDACANRIELLRMPLDLLGHRLSENDGQCVEAIIGSGSAADKRPSFMESQYRETGEFGDHLVGSRDSGRPEELDSEEKRDLMRDTGL